MRNSNQMNINEEFVCLMSANQKRIYGFILTLVPHLPDADDILQQTVMVMCRKFESYNRDQSFSAWAMGIAKNVVLQFRQKEQQSKMLLSDQAFHRVVSRSDRLVDTMESRVNALEGCINKLSQKDQELIKLRYNSGLRVKEIALKVGRPLQGLYQAFGRIHVSLKECIDRHMAQWERSV